MKIGVRKILYMIIWISLVQGILSDYWGLGLINYFNDVLLLICVLLQIREKFYNRNKFIWGKYVCIPLLCFWIIIQAGWILNGVSFILALWGVRNYFRFFLFFFLCLNIFDTKDYEKIQNWLMKLFPIHILFIIFQISVERLSYDYLGGFFGKYQGCANGLMIYYGLLAIILLSKYEKKEISFKKMFLYFTLILGTSAIAELKAFFLLFGVMIIFYVFISKDKIKSMLILSLGMVGAVIGIQLLIRYFPYYSDFFTFKNIVKQLTNKESSYTYRQGLDIGRSSIFYKLPPVIREWGGDMAEWLGLGLGNGEYSTTFNFLTSNFYNTYPRSNYMFFSLAFLFVETGYLGVIAYVAFFLGTELAACKNYLRRKYINNMVPLMLPIFCLFLIYYNSSIRTNYAFIIFGLLPIVFDTRKPIKIENGKYNFG